MTFTCSLVTFTCSLVTRCHRKAHRPLGGSFLDPQPPAPVGTTRPVPVSRNIACTSRLALQRGGATPTCVAGALFSRAAFQLLLKRERKEERAGCLPPPGLGGDSSGNWEGGTSWECVRPSVHGSGQLLPGGPARPSLQASSHSCRVGTARRWPSRLQLPF